MNDYPQRSDLVCHIVQENEVTFQITYDIVRFALDISRLTKVRSSDRNWVWEEIPNSTWLVVSSMSNIADIMAFLGVPFREYWREDGSMHRLDGPAFIDHKSNIKTWVVDSQNIPELMNLDAENITHDLVVMCAIANLKNRDAFLRIGVAINVVSEQESSAIRMTADL